MFFSQKKHHPQYSTWHNWHNHLDSCDFPAGRTMDSNYCSEFESIEVGFCVQGTLYLRWKLRGGNVVQSPNMAPSTYTASQEKGMLYWVWITQRSSRVQMALLQISVCISLFWACRRFLCGIQSHYTQTILYTIEESTSKVT